MVAASDARDLVALARHALDRGARVEKPGQVQWDVYGRCTSPVVVERHARERSVSDPHAYQLGKREFLPLTVTMETPCRKCEACLRHRARSWALRAQQEINAAARTWFATLTLSPDKHYLMLLRARARLSARGVSFEALTPEEQFAERHASVSEELTLWVKRLRKNTEAPLRLLLVAEAHKTGLPHYHGLIHEQDPERPVRHAQLAGSWPHGFTKFKLVAPDEGARRTAWYVCKYLTKDNRARVRASLSYGKVTHEMHSNSTETGPPEANALGEVRGNSPPERAHPSENEKLGAQPADLKERTP